MPPTRHSRMCHQHRHSRMFLAGTSQYMHNTQTDPRLKHAGMTVCYWVIGLLGHGFTA